MLVLDAELSCLANGVILIQDHFGRIPFLVRGVMQKLFCAWNMHFAAEMHRFR